MAAHANVELSSPMESPAFARSLFLDISSRFLRSAASRSSFFRSALILACAASSDSAVFFDGFDEPAEVNYLVIRGSADAGCRQKYCTKNADMDII